MPPEPSASKARLKRKTSRRETEEYRFDGSHAREIEQKRNNGQISCAECRRLKIKCDKQIPCQSCQRRGCAALCPNGSLATGQGTRFVLAATEHLHRQISQMGERIRQLEDALGDLQSRVSSEPHPLLRADLLDVGQRDDEEEGAGIGASSGGESGGQSQPAELSDTFGTLSITDHGIARFFGPTGGSECLLMSDTIASQEGASSPSDSVRDSKSPPLPQELQMFSHAFPFTPMGPVSAVRDVIESHLPTPDRARYLVQTYVDQAAWLFHSVPPEQIMEELLPIYYPDGSHDILEEGRSAHDLALLFLVFAVGALVDLAQEPGNSEAEHYHQIARAAICLQPVLEKPSLVTIQTLHLLSIYTALSGNELTTKETSMETTWSLVTLAAHLSQTIGLHRDSARWNLPDKVVQRRRILFWDLFVADAWNSLHTGRPPGFSRAYVDCQYPQSPGKREGEETEDSVLFESWGYRFAAECVAEVAARTLTAEAPSYATIMELDRKVREFPIPVPTAQVLSHPSGNLPLATVDEDMSIPESMSRFVMTHSREVILLYIHRSYFAQAIIENPINPLKSQYSPSFLAAYRASSTVLRTISMQFTLQPLMCTRFWSTWTFAFSAAIVFGTIVTRGPRSPLASQAMKELDDACLLFTKAATQNRRAAKALPILTKLSEKAHISLAAAQKDVPSAGLGQQWSVKEEEEDDELSIFAGRTRFVSSKRLPDSSSTSSDTTRIASSSNHGVHEPQPQSAAPMYRTQLPPPLPTAGGVMDGWGPTDPERYPLRPIEYPDATMGPPPLLPPPSQIHMVSNWPPPPSRQSDYSYTSGHPHLPGVVPGAEPTPNHSHTWSSDMSQPFRTTSFEGGVGNESHAGYRPPPHAYEQTLPPPPAHVYHNHEHGRAPHPHLSHHLQHQSQQHHEPNARAAPSELADLGLVSQESRLDERWTSFMRDSGYFEGYRGR